LVQKTGVNTARTLYKEIQSGSVTKSFMRKGFLIYEEMRKCFPIYEEALVIYDFAPDTSLFPNTVYEENLISFFSVNDRVLVHYTQCITISTEQIEETDWRDCPSNRTIKNLHKLHTITYCTRTKGHVWGEWTSGGTHMRSWIMKQISKVEEETVHVVFKYLSRKVRCGGGNNVPPPPPS
jgi:hypothetical protein